jgi:hypothetical protein
MNEKLRCTKCGGQGAEVRKMIAEENWVGIPDQDVKFTNRWFDAVCPECGPILCNKVGHHGTFRAKELKSLFPKAKLRQLRAALPAKERRLFNDTLNGRRLAKEGEVESWLALLNSTSPRDLNVSSSSDSKSSR